MGPYAVKEGAVVIPEDGLGLDLDPARNGIAARMRLVASVEIENPPIPSASLFNFEAQLTVRAPVAMLGPPMNSKTRCS